VTHGRHTPPFHNRRKAVHKEKRRAEEKRITAGRERTQWCSGITCVLAKLRAHYPEHQHKEEEEQEEEQEERREDGEQ
jgi:hypothetical protein